MTEIKYSKQTGIEIYTDAVKDKEVVAAAVNKTYVFSARPPDEATIFSAEAKAIELAFEYIKISKYTYFTIFSDSLRSLQSLHSMHIDHSYILDILVTICWIPSQFYWYTREQ